MGVEWAPYEPFIVPRKDIPPQAVIPRSEWGALPPSSTTPLTSCPVLQVGFIATGQMPCSSQEECTKAVQEMQRHHMDDLGMSDIAYNFVICSKNLVYEGRGWENKSDKVNPNQVYWDGTSIDIGYIGVFNDDEPPFSVLDTRDCLVSDGIINNYIDRRASYFN